MVTMDSAARAIDQMLHRGRAEERDGGVWLDDLAANDLADALEMAAEGGWQELAEDLLIEVKYLESEVKRWRKVQEQSRKDIQERGKVLRSVRSAVNGKGQMREKLAKVREIVDGAW